MRAALSIFALTLFIGIAAADGRRITSEAFLRAKLKELQSSYDH